MAALDGVRVIDLTQFEAGTSCTESLAWLGADVIKVEKPGFGDQGRQAYGDVPEFDPYYFLLLNANKRSVTLDLKSEQGRGILRRLSEHADVFVENFAPGTIEHLGFDYETLREINPRLIYAQIKGFDPDGPYANFLSLDPVAQAVGGATSLTGLPDVPPMRAGPGLADTGAGLHLAIGILAALYQRESTGHGQKVRVAMQEAVINFCRFAYARTLESGEPFGRYGNTMGLITAPANVYPCQPGGANDYIVIYTSRAPNAVQWDRLMDVIERPDLKGEERFATPEKRYAHAQEIDILLSSWTAGRTKREAMETLASAGVPAGAVLDTLELSNDPQLRKNGTFVTVDHPQRGSFTMPGWPVRMTDSSVPIVAAPLLGQQSREVLGEVLNMEPGELDELERSAVI